MAGQGKIRSSAWSLRIPIYRVPYFNGSPKAESDNLPVISDSIVSETCCDR